MPRHSKSREEDADFIGPLKVAVGCGLAYMLWLTFRASSPFPSDAYPSQVSTDLDPTKDR